MTRRDYDALIIGAGLTGLVTAYRLQTAGLRVALIERSAQIGGAIQTEQAEGFTLEQGPTTGIISTLEMASLLRDFPELKQLASLQAKRRLILKTLRGEQRFFPLPYSLSSAITTPLFSLRDKLRLLGEPFRKPGEDPTESVASLVRRRLGKSFLDYAVDPFIGGIYAGKPEALVTRYALPKLYALEQEHGSFIRGAIAKARQPKDELNREVTKEIFSTKGGLSSLIHALGESLGADRLYLSAEQCEVKQEVDGAWVVSFLQGEQAQLLRARHVVTTVPAPALTSLLPFLTEVTLSPILKLRYAPIVQVAYGVATDLPQFHAFGGLIPTHEDPYMLGMLHPSACFPDRAPAGGSLLSIFLGGMRAPELIDWSDEEVLRLVQERLERLLRLTIAPTIQRIYRHRLAIPQYEASSAERLACIARLEQGYPGLHLGGAICDGIGIPDRVKQAFRFAREIIAS